MIGNHITIRPRTELESAGEVIVNVERVGHAHIAELTQVRVVGMPRKGAAAFPQRFGLEIAVAIHHGHATARHIIGMLQFPAIGEVIVVTLRKGDTRRIIESGVAAPTGCLQSLQGGGGIAKTTIHLPMQGRIDQSHAGGDVFAIPGRRAQVFTENHGIVARQFMIEHRITMVVPVGESARQVKLSLNAAVVAEVGSVHSLAALLAIEIGGHVFDGVQPEAIGSRAVHLPAHRTDQGGVHILAVEPFIFLQILDGDAVVRTETHIFPVISRMGSAIRTHPVRVILRVIGMTQKRDLGIPIAFVGTVVLIGCFVRDIDEVGQTQVLHLPDILPVTRVIPLAIKTFFGDTEMEILGQHARINIDGRVFIETRNIKGPVIHDVIEIDANAKTMRDADHFQKFRFRAVAGADRVALILAAQIEGVP